MSLSSIDLNPLIDDPSKPSPVSYASPSMNSEAGTVKLWRIPLKSLKKQSTFFTPVFFSKFFVLSISDLSVITSPTNY